NVKTYKEYQQLQDAYRRQKEYEASREAAKQRFDRWLRAEEAAEAAKTAKGLLGLAALENLLWLLGTILAEKWAEDVGSLFAHLFPKAVKDFARSKVGQAIIPFLFSEDPNNLLGPAGFGTQGFVTPQQPLPYTIQFENDPTKATVAAQEVTVKEQLD